MVLLLPFLESSWRVPGGVEIPPSRFLQKIEQTVSGFVVYPLHHVAPVPPAPVPPALLAAKFVYVREDASVPRSLFGLGTAD